MSTQPPNRIDDSTRAEIFKQSDILRAISVTQATEVVERKQLRETIDEVLERVERNTKDIGTLKAWRALLVSVTIVISTFVGGLAAIYQAKIADGTDFIASKGQEVRDYADTSIKTAISEHEGREEKIIDYRISLWVDKHKTSQDIPHKQTVPNP